MNRILKYLFVAMALAGLHYFIEKQTHGFRYHHLLSNLPYDARWALPPVQEETLSQINARLDQPFTFLGGGGWCYAFLGEDEKTVLKFFKHTDLCFQNLFKQFSFQKLFLKSPPEEANDYYFHPFNFNSCMLLYHHCQKESGIQYLHLNKTRGLHPTVTLYDPVGVPHQIQLDQTEFIVQEKAELLIPHLKHLIHKGEIEEAKEAIDALLNCLLSFYQKGIRDDDHGLRNNFGYIGGKPVTLDLSSWVEDASIKEPARYKKELVIKTLVLGRWLNKYHPALYNHFNDQLCAIIDSRENPESNRTNKTDTVKNPV